MANGITGVSIYLLAGMKVKLKVPIDPDTGIGEFVMHGDVNVNNKQKTLINGFVVEDDDVGILEAVAKEPAVIYYHRKPFNNAVWFYSLSGDRGLVNIIAVPIHDHSSIMQGGPAFGSFFSSDETIQ